MRAPAFQFYPADFMMGTMAMSAAEVGGYIRLLCFQWEHGPFPDDAALIARVTGCDGNAVACIRHKFVVIEDGLLANARLERVRLDQAEYRKKQAANANKRWNDAKPHAVALPTHMRSNMPNACPPTPTPTPTPTTSTNSSKAPSRVPTRTEWLAEAKSAHPEWPFADAESAFNYYEANGWKRGKTQIVKWRACLATCFANWRGKARSQTSGNRLPENLRLGYSTPDLPHAI